MKILESTKDWVAVDKPAGWLSVPSTKGKNDPRSVVGIELQKEWGPIFPLHRLDFEVSGVLLFARNAKTQTYFQDLWQSGKVQKIYRALTPWQDFSHWPDSVKGALKDQPQKHNEWVSFLAAGKKRSFVAPHGMKSITKAEIKSEQENHVEWELEPVTGRRHQLRVELSRRGFPIWGDSLYGSSMKAPAADHIALQAVALDVEGEFKIEKEWSWDLWLKK